MEGRDLRLRVNERPARSEAASREKNNDCSHAKFCRNIVYVSSIAKDFSFHFLHVLPNYEYKEALFWIIAETVLCILCWAMAVVVLDVSYSWDVVFSLVLLVDFVTKGKVLLCSFYFCWKTSRRCVLRCLHIMFWKNYNSSWELLGPLSSRWITRRKVRVLKVLVGLKWSWVRTSSIVSAKTNMIMRWR